MELELPQGRLHHPILAVGAVILKENRILLVQRRNPPYSGCWTIPGGKVKFGESTRDALVREIKEECGLEVVPGRIIDVIDHIEVSYDAPEVHYVIVDFYVESFSGSLIAGSDAFDARWVDHSGLEDLQIPELTRRFLEKHEILCQVCRNRA